MAITQVNVSTPSIEILYTSTAIGNFVEAVKSSSAKVYWIQVDNSLNVASSYLRLWNLAAGSVTNGTTPADQILYVPASSIVTYIFTTGAAPGLVFGTALSASCVTTAGTGGNTSPSSSVTCTISYV